MDWTDVEARLKERALDVARHLLPNGKQDGLEWACGSVNGEAGHSLKVHIGLAKPGVWTDFAGSGGGKTLMSLWCAVRGAEFKVCIREAKEFLGLRDDFYQRVRTAYPVTAPAEKPDDFRAVNHIWPECEPLVEGGLVWNYLVNERKIQPEVVRLYDVREKIQHGRWVMVFPYWSPPEDTQCEVKISEPQPAWLKYEALERVDGKKREWTTPGPEKMLWGCQLRSHSVFKKCRHVLLCEGEKDAMTWASYGCHEWGVIPVSVPFGAKWKGQDKGRPSPNREWLDRCWDWLENFETVYVAMDGDDAGKRAAQDIISEVGPRRCRLVTLPLKDANECLKAGVSGEAIKACLDTALDFAPEKVKSSAAFYEAFMAEWFDKELESGLDLPFEFPWKIRPGELTVWTGIEKSGKTTLLGYVMCALMAQGERALIASFEIKAAKTLKKLSRQIFGGLIRDPALLEKCSSDEERAACNESFRDRAQETFQWMCPRLWLYDHTGIGQWRQLADDIRWARRRHGITQFVVDNFMRLGIVKDDYAQQADAITMFSQLAMDLDCHIHMVVHQNKTEGKRESQGKRSVAGAFEIIANAHNIVEVWRDVAKGEKVSEAFEKKKAGTLSFKDFEDEIAALNDIPDGKFILHAQRDGEHQNGSKYLWFHWQSQQYCDVPKGHRQYGPLQFTKINAAPNPTLIDAEDVP